MSERQLVAAISFETIVKTGGGSHYHSSKQFLQFFLTHSHFWLLSIDFCCRSSQYLPRSTLSRGGSSVVGNGPTGEMRRARWTTPTPSSTWWLIKQCKFITFVIVIIANEQHDDTQSWTSTLDTRPKLRGARGPKSEIRWKETAAFSQSLAIGPSTPRTELSHVTLTHWGANNLMSSGISPQAISVNSLHQ